MEIDEHCLESSIRGAVQLAEFCAVTRDVGGERHDLADGHRVHRLVECGS